ncbi:hypothetical protein FJO69_00980 [[Mycoplasma] falconis]|uniref:Uncharacterized protein n=1 Tax=[Mycoplasma] falconis TaxID=92403 RepID=A0A501XBN2_9BACT|nr:hypothetical protein [[Mycoplasma] falconis]TPE57757.1 hypothetical protein FJO69_00980 [[Mycoplasma] falconis]
MFKKNKGLLIGILATITSISTLFPLIKKQIAIDEPKNNNDLVDENQKIVDIVNEIINNYDTKDFPNIIKDKEELEELIKEGDKNKIEDKVKELKEKIENFVDDFNKKSEDLAINFFEGYKNIDLYNNELANNDLRNSSFLKNDLLGWNVNDKIREEIINASLKYFTSETQEETIKVKTEEEFNKLINEAYKIDLDNWKNPKIPNISKQKIEDKYLSVIFETSRVLRKHILENFREGVKFISESRFVLPNNIWFQMMNKTFGYFALNNKQAKEYSLEYINSLKLDDYNAKNGWVIPNDKDLFTPNENYMLYYSDFWPVWSLNKEKGLYWSLYPYFAYAYLYNDILDAENTILQPDQEMNYFEFVKNNEDKFVYNKELLLEDFLSRESYDWYLETKQNWFDNPAKLEELLENKKLEFSFNVFEVINLNWIPYTPKQKEVIRHQNISVLNYKYFEEAVSLFDEIIRNKVLELKEKLKSKKIELEKDELQNQEIIDKINKLLVFPEYDQIQETLMKKYDMFKDGFINKAEEILK